METRPAGLRPWSRLNWSSSHWVHTAIALAAIGLYVAGGLAQSKVGALPPDFPLDDLTYPAHVGQHVVVNEAELAARVAGEQVGFPLLVRGADGAVDRLVQIRAFYTPFHRAVARINGLFFLSVSLLVFAPRIDKTPARDLFWACVLYGLAVMIGGVHRPQGALWPGVLLPLLRIVSLVILPALTFHVGLSFPRRTAALDRLPWLMPAVLGVGLVVALWQFWAWTRWFEGTGSWHAVDRPRLAGAVYLALFFGAGCGCMIYGYNRLERERERQQIKWLLWGIAMGAAPYVFLHGLPAALDRRPLLPAEVARLFSIVIPIGMSFVVIRHRFLDVDIIIRRSLLYVLLASIMVGIYAVIGILIGQRVEDRWPQTGPLVPIVATTVAAMLFAPTRQGIGRLIDQVFFKIRYNHAQALAAFRAELREADSQQRICEILAAFLGRHLRPRRIHVELRREGETWRAGTDDGPVPEDTLPAGVPVQAVPGWTARADLESDGFPESWRAAEYVLAHAIEAEGDRSGHFLLGEKSTGRSYVVEDLDLLAAAARESAICAHRLGLQQDFVEEVVARRRVEEMNRFRTQFFAQFAHDLRSPLTSINWAARNLLDGVVGEVSGPQSNYLEGIESSARQLVRLVNNLLEATRLETGLPEVEFDRIDLAATVAESVSKLRATAGAKDLELVVDASEPAPVHGNEEKLLEVVDNLLENAIRYAPPGSRVDVTVTAGDEQSKFVVEDRGPGLDPDELDAIFEAYRQGAASPHSTQQGFGLGLFVVKSWVERMGGKVQAGNREGGGARFTFVLPARETAATQERS